MFQKQSIMRKVVYSLVPIFAFSVLLYGWRAIAVTAVVFAVGIAVEYAFVKPKGKKVTEAVLVTCALYALSMPPAVPLWIAAVGIAFGISFGKMIFGGFGRNIFNPAIAGRLFVYVSFPDGLQRSFLQPWRPGMPWRFGFDVVADTATAATPLADMKEGVIPELMDLALGFRIGSLGESAGLLIIAAGIYLIWTKTANWKMIVSTLLSFIAVITGLWFFGIAPAGSNVPFPPVHSLFAGSILYISVFMVTDPVSAPNKSRSQWVYGIIIGSVSAAVRVFSLFPEGVSFGIFIGNTFASLLDEWFPAPKKKPVKKPVKKKPAAKAVPQGGAS